MKIEDGGPAFPQPDNLVLTYKGMTLRDYFAAKAMQSMIARTNWGVEDDAIDIANEAYGYADAMLKARESNG